MAKLFLENFEFLNFSKFLNNKSFIPFISKLNINGDCSLMVEYGSVAPEKRVRFPPFAFKLEIAKEIKESGLKWI